MERSIPEKGPEHLAAQPTPTSDAPPAELKTAPDGLKARIVKRVLSKQEEAALTERQNVFNDLATITAQQMAVLGLEMNGPVPVLLSLLYTQVRQMSAMVDAMTDLLLTAPLLAEAPNPDPAKAAAGLEPVIVRAPVSFLTYMKACALKGEQQVSMIHRQILSAGGAVPPLGGKGQ